MESKEQEKEGSQVKHVGKKLPPCHRGGKESMEHGWNLSAVGTLLDVVDGEEGEGKLGIFYRREKTRVRNNTQHEKRKSQLEQNGKDNEWEVERMLTLDVLPLVSAT